MAVRGFDISDVLVDSPHFRGSIARYDSEIKDAQGQMKTFGQNVQGVADAMISHSDHTKDVAKMIATILSDEKWEGDGFHTIAKHLQNLSNQEKATAESLIQIFGAKSRIFEEHELIDNELNTTRKSYEASGKELETNEQKFFKDKKKKSMTSEDLLLATHDLSAVQFRNQRNGLQFAHTLIDSCSLKQRDLVEFCLEYVAQMIDLNQESINSYNKLKPILKELSLELEEKELKRAEGMSYFSTFLDNHKPESLLDANSEYHRLANTKASEGSVHGYLYTHTKPCANSPLNELPNKPALTKKEKRTSNFKKLDGNHNNSEGNTSEDIVKCEYCVIHEGQLYLCGDRDTKLSKAREQVALADCMISYRFPLVDGRHDRPYSFEVHTIKQSFFFQGHSNIEVDHWIKAISNYTTYKHSATSRELVDMQNVVAKPNTSNFNELREKVTLELHNVVGLRQRDMDIHAIISVGKQQVKTDKIKKTKLPIWNRQFFFDVVSNDAEIEIAFFDTSSPFRSRSIIGTTVIAISELPKDTTIKRGFKLFNDKGAVIGEVNISLNLAVVTQEKLSIADFELISVIGKGSYGKVIQAKKHDTKQVYAIKIVKKTDALNVNDTNAANLKRERDVMAKVNHPFLMTLQFAFQSDTKLYYVLNFVNGGELYFHLQRAKKFDFVRSQFYAAEILLALEYLHKLDIIYRDLKAENILLDFHGHICLIDFGLCKQAVEGQTNTLCGTPDYVAPEVFNQNYGKEIDWWSFGVLIWEMLFSAPPFHDNDVNEVFQKIFSKDLSDALDVIEEIEEDNLSNMEIIRDILLKLLERNPKERLGYHGADEIKKHKFFEGMDFELLVKRHIVPPFRPKVESEVDTTNFDQRLLQVNPRDTLEVSFLSSEQQELFRGFSFSLDDSSGRNLSQSIFNNNSAAAASNLSHAVIDEEEEDLNSMNFIPSDSSNVHGRAYSVDSRPPPTRPNRKPPLPVRTPSLNPPPPAPPRPRKPSPIL